MQRRRWKMALSVQSNNYSTISLPSIPTLRRVVRWLAAHETRRQSATWTSTRQMPLPTVTSPSRSSLPLSATGTMAQCRSQRGRASATGSRNLYPGRKPLLRSSQPSKHKGSKMTEQPRCKTGSLQSLFHSPRAPVCDAYARDRLLQQVIPPEDIDSGAETPIDPRSSNYVQRPAFSLPLMANNFRRFNAR